MQLDQQLSVMQNGLEILIWDQKELEEHLQLVVKERKMKELVLAELEDEHDIAIAKIEQLGGKVNICILLYGLYCLFSYLFNCKDDLKV